MLGIPPNEILDAGRTCPRCGEVAPPPDECHVCHGPGAPDSYWKTLTGSELPDEGPVVALIAMAAGGVGVEEGGRVDRGALAEFFLQAGITTTGERAAWRRLLAAYLLSLAAAENLATWERTRPKADKPKPKGKGKRR